MAWHEITLLLALKELALKAWAFAVNKFVTVGMIMLLAAALPSLPPS